MEYDAMGAVAGDRLSDAADLFGKAWEIFKRADSICNRGSLLLQIGRYRDAAESLEICRRASPESNGAMNQVVKHTLDKARAEIGTITVTTNVPGAQILVDNKVVGTAPLEGPVFVELGRHVVEARAEGYATDARLIASSKGSWREVSLRLEPPMKPGLVMQEPTPLPEEPSKTSAPIGPGSRSHAAASTASSAPAPQDGSGKLHNPSSSTGPIFFGIGVGLIGVGIATVSLLGAAEKRTAAAELSNAIDRRGPKKACSEPEADPQCGTVTADRESASLLTALGVASTVLSASAVAFTIYEIVDGGSGTTTTYPRVAVGASPGGAAVFLTGSF